MTLVNDVDTRWNSTLAMLEALLHCKVALVTMYGTERPAAPPTSKSGLAKWNVHPLTMLYELWLLIHLL